MVDYSRATTSKAAKDAFDSTADSLIRAIESLKGEYSKEWETEEEYRKGRAAIIENVKPILKEHDIKLRKPLDRCNNEELMEELDRAAQALPYEDREEIEVAKVRIDGRYTQIVEQAKILEALNDKLAKYHLPEKDYDQEVIISINDLKKSHETKREEVKEVKEETPKQTETIIFPTTRESRHEEDLEEVTDVYQADEALLSSFNEMVETELVEVEPHILEESDIVVVDEDEDEEYTFDDAFDSLFDEDRENSDDTSLMEEFLEAKEEMMNEEPEYQIYELKDDQTLSEIVDYVYEGKLSWYDIYLYKDNKGMIDRKCAELVMDPEDAAYEKGVLTGLMIEYPKNFVTYQGYKNEEKEEEKGFAKAA